MVTATPTPFDSMEPNIFCGMPSETVVFIP